jgi:hypothetical protein
VHACLFGRHERWLGPSGKVGFHQPGIPGLDSETAAQLIDQERRRLTSMGLPSDFIAKVLDTPNSKMWYPTQKELVAARVISGISDGSRFAASGGPALLSAAELEKTLLKTPLFASLQRAEPETFKELIAQLVDVHRRGYSDEKRDSIIRSTVSKSVSRRLPYASDAELLKWVDITVSYMAELKSADPESCVAIEDPSKGAKLKANLLKDFPTIASKELALKQVLFESNLVGTRAIPTDKQIEPYLEKLVDKLANRSDIELSLLRAHPRSLDS